jgi:predicted DNA-binding transcriptional regulator AlpA
MDRVLSVIETAARLGVTRRSLEYWRASGEGPPYVRLGPRRAGYRESDLIRWIEANTHADHAAERVAAARRERKHAERLAAERAAAAERRARFAPEAGKAAEQRREGEGKAA